MLLLIFWVFVVVVCLYPLESVLISIMHPFLLKSYFDPQIVLVMFKHITEIYGLCFKDREVVAFVRCSYLLREKSVQ